MGSWLRYVLDLALPGSCEVCGCPLPAGHVPCLCDPCLASIQPPPPPRCTRCDAPITAARGFCPCRRRAPAFATARALGLYRPDDTRLNPLAIAVRRLKFEGRRTVAATLGDLLAARYPFAADALVVPVPLHPRRLRARGFNQALLLAHRLARRRCLDLGVRALVRLRDTAAQADLGADGRQANIRAAFAVRQPATVVGRAIVLVDDVMTTGATANACASALRAAGAERVDVLTVGRAP